MNSCIRAEEGPLCGVKEIPVVLLPDGGVHTSRVCENLIVYPFLSYVKYCNCMFENVFWGFMLHIVLLLSSCCQSPYIFNCEHLYFCLCFVFHLYLLPWYSNPANLIWNILPAVLGCTLHFCHPSIAYLPSHLHLLYCVLLCSLVPSFLPSFLPSMVPSFSPPTLTLVTMPSPGWHTVKLQHPPSATAALISATPPLGMR